MATTQTQGGANDPLSKPRFWKSGIGRQNMLIASGLNINNAVMLNINAVFVRLLISSPVFSLNSDALVKQLRFLLIYMLNKLLQSIRGEALCIGIVFFSNGRYPSQQH